MPPLPVPFPLALRTSGAAEVLVNCIILASRTTDPPLELVPVAFAWLKNATSLNVNELPAVNEKFAPLPFGPFALMEAPPTTKSASLVSSIPPPPPAELLASITKLGEVLPAAILAALRTAISPPLVVPLAVSPRGPPPVLVIVDPVNDIKPP